MNWSLLGTTPELQGMVLAQIVFIGSLEHAHARQNATAIRFFQGNTMSPVPRHWIIQFQARNVGLHQRKPNRPHLTLILVQSHKVPTFCLTCMHRNDFSP